jgi:1,4-dihydroxy-2-naphthoyl-CoA hydrolase
MTIIENLQKSTQGLFPGVMGIRFIHASADEIRAEMEVTRAMCTLPGRMHGGAIMAFADTLGAYGTVLSLPDGAGTTTVESKTNFFSSGVEGGKVLGTTTPLHRGRSTMVWQTRVERDDGRLVAVVTQTQIVLPRTKEPGEQMADLFAGREPAEQMEVLALLERSGGGLYRAWANAETDPKRAAELRAAADREDQNAALLESITRSDDGSR